MADVTNKHVLTNAKIEFGGVDISSKASNLTVEDTAEEIDFTAFSENGYREFGF